MRSGIALQVSIRWPRVPWVALDFEVTDINLRGRVLQYAICGVGDDGSVLEAHGLVDAQTPTGRDPARIPGVDLTALAQARPFCEHADDIARLLTGAVVVMHNAPFDWRVLKREFERVGATLPRPRALVCTLWLSKHGLRLPIPRHRLCDVCAFLEYSPGVPFHNAVHDAWATLWVALAVWQRWPTACARLMPGTRGLMANRSPHFVPLALRRLRLTLPDFFDAHWGTATERAERAERSSP